ncbi:site-specific integrase [Paracoccus aurantiacus]|uniref:Site-specific integrase n=1 Tax=Paracoccus aurantiacus TaxID=2599412 RepID=A0A5C6RUR1_9RHOB|nr:site-specific integrase [Paracoccus aurantiacus]TXB65695.1 site-specific integrase [Paracoccus aurantiacus]
MRNREKLTEKLVRAAETRPKAWQVFDTDVLGLSICIYTSGSRSFMFDYRTAGRQRRFTIGRWPEWSVTAARDRAKVLRREVDSGIDPMAEREDAREAPRFPDLVERYLREHAAHLAPRNAADQESMLRKLIEPHWKHRLVTEIEAADVERVLNLIAQGRSRPAKKTPKTKRREPLKPPKPTPIRANRAGEMLRKVFNLAIAWKMRSDNPALGFRRRMEVERERFLSMDEIARLGDALTAAEDQRAAAVVRMCMLTGARLGEVRTCRFEHFDLERAIWTKPAANTKQRRVHRVPVSLDTVALVRTRIDAVPPGCDWLFPGDVEDKDQPVQEIRRFWIDIQQQAEIPGVRIHDLRHTFASLLVSGGASLEMIGKLLGHSQSRTTQRYAHLMDSPLRAGVDAVADMIRIRPRLVHSAPTAAANGTDAAKPRRVSAARLG